MTIELKSHYEICEPESRWYMLIINWLAESIFRLFFWLMLQTSKLL